MWQSLHYTDTMVYWGDGIYTIALKFTWVDYNSYTQFPFDKYAHFYLKFFVICSN